MSHKSQVRPARKRATGVSVGFLIAALSMSLAGAPTAIGCSTRASVLGAGSVNSEPPLYLVAKGQEKVGLRQAELNADPDELWALNPRLCLRVLVLRAGREVPATVTAARRSERLAQREAALVWLRERLAVDARVARLWESVVQTRLAQPQKSVLWCAVVRTLGRLGASSSGLQIAGELQSEDPLRAHTSRLALFDLYLRWFQSGEEFYAFWPEAQASCEEGIYITTAREKDDEARELLIQLLEHEPSRAAGLLSHPDPRLRAAAIGALSLSQGDEAELAAETLLEHLTTEVDGLAFHATINALLQTQSNAPSTDPLVARTRQILLMRLAQGHVELQAPLADSIRRLPWSTAAEGEDSLTVAIDALVGQLQSLANPERLTDRDTLVMCLTSLRSVCERGAREGLDVVTQLAPVGPLLLAMIEEAPEAQAVRIAAAEFLRYVGNGSGVELAVAVIGAEETSSELRYILLGAIGDMATKMEPTDASIDLVLRTLAVHVQGEDPILRRRSLKYLGAPTFAPFLTQADPRAFIAALAKETVPELQLQLLDLIEAHGSEAQLASLVALPNFDAICGSSPAALNRMAMSIRKLAGGKGPELVAGVGRLLQITDEETDVLRLREALNALAALPVEAVATLQPADHHRVVLWSMELRGAAGAVPGGAVFLDRLLNNHLAACASIPELERSPELAHVRALFLSDLIALDGTALEPETVAEAFGQALVLCLENSDGPRHKLVLRDRARYLLERKSLVAAAADYLALVQSELPALEANLGTPSKLLNQRDLRQAGALFSSDSASDAEAGKNPSAVALRSSLVLVHQSIWRVEPVAVRAQDLRDLAGRAMTLRNAETVARALNVFQDLPAIPTPPAEGEPAVAVTVPEGSLWTSLLDDPVVHLEFVGTRKQLSEHHAALLEANAAANQGASETQDGPPQKPGAEAEDPGSASEKPGGQSGNADEGQTQQERGAKDAAKKESLSRG